MAATFRLDTTGAIEIEQRLASLAAAFGDLTPLMEGMGIYLESATIDRFDTETAPDGQRWLKSQRAEDDGGKTLTDSSQLRSSITSEATGHSVLVGSNKVYAGIHQFGFDEAVQIKRHSRTIRSAFGRALKEQVTFEVNSFERLLKMPARPFLGLSSEDEQELLAQAEDYARSALGDGGGS